MPIDIRLYETGTNLFCASKWWGAPDMPEDMKYPSENITDEDGTWECPLTFLCQISCEDIAGLDPENLLPHEGMLYFFASIGRDGTGKTSVKYTRSVNMETFRTVSLCDDCGNATEASPYAMEFSCGESAPAGMLLKDPSYPDSTVLLRVRSGFSLDIVIKDTDLGFRNWSRTFGTIKGTER